MGGNNVNLQQAAALNHPRARAAAAAPQKRLLRQYVLR